MKRVKVLLTAFLLLCIGLGLIPLMAVSDDATPKPKRFAYDTTARSFSLPEGIYDAGIELTVYNGGEVEGNTGENADYNACPKAILLRGDSITTSGQLIEYMQKNAGEVREELKNKTTAEEVFDDQGEKVGVHWDMTQEDIDAVIKYVVLLAYGIEADEEDLEDLKKYYHGSGEWDYTYKDVYRKEADQKFMEFLTAVARKGAGPIFLERALYQNGPFVQDNYVDGAFDNLGHSPKVDFGDKSITFTLPQQIDREDYYLFVLDSKDINAPWQNDFMEKDAFSVYHYQIRGLREFGREIHADQKVTLPLLDEENPGMIRYTTDGSDPRDSETAQDYEKDGILISANPGECKDVVIKYCQVKEQQEEEDVKSLLITIDKPKEAAPVPAASLEEGLYKGEQKVKLFGEDVCETLTVYYTLDGSDPKTSETVMKADPDGAITITGKTPGETTDVVIRAYAEGKDNYTQSETVEFRYQIQSDKVSAPTPTADLPEGVYTANQKVKLSFDEEIQEGLKVYYTLDGSDPRTSDTRILYNGDPISLIGEINEDGSRSTVELKAAAVGENNYTMGEVFSRTYTFEKTNLKAVSLSLNGGSTEADWIPLRVEMTGEVPYDGKAHVLSGSTGGTADLTVDVDSPLLEFATYQTTVVNNTAADGGAYILLTLVPNADATQEQKAIISRVNTQLATKKLYFTITPAQLRKDNIKVTVKKNKVKVVYTAPDGRKIKLKKKDFTVKKAKKKITVTGIGNFTGKVKVKVKGMSKK